MVGGVTLLSGVLVLAGAVAAARRRHLYEAVVLKVLGARRSDLLRIFLIEYLGLGATAALAGGLLGTLGAARDRHRGHASGVDLRARGRHRWSCCWRWRSRSPRVRRDLAPARPLCGGGVARALTLRICATARHDAGRATVTGMMAELSLIGLLSAFAAGVISFLSPCVLPLVPGYVSFVAGSSLEDLRDGAAPRCTLA